MATHTTKTNNRHKVRLTTECKTCGRKLPNRAFREQCATCIKREQGKTDSWKRVAA